MPFARNTELPANVRTNLPVAAQTIWRGAFNAAIETRTEQSSIRIAWGALRTAGWAPSGRGDGKWVKKGREPNLQSEYDDPNHPAYTLSVVPPDDPEYLDFVGGPGHMTVAEIQAAQALGKSRDDAPNLGVVSRFAPKRCGTCGFFRGGHCELFDFDPSPREHCDAWVPWIGKRSTLAPDEDEFDVTLTGTVVKLDEEHQMVFGWGYVCRKATGELVVDHSGEIVSIETIEHAGYDYCLNARDMKAMHTGSVKGALIELFVSTPEKRGRMGIPEGCLPDGIWLGFKINDAEAWADVKSGKTRMFSLGGRARRRDASNAT